MAWTHYVNDAGSKLVLFNQGLLGKKDVRVLGQLTRVRVGCRLDPGTAFWHPDEAQALDSLEDALISALDRWGRGWAIYACRVAQRGWREYLIYHSGAADIARAVADVASSFQDYSLRADTGSDPEWKAFEGLARKVE